MRKKRCNRCGEHKPRSEFRFGLQPCKQCREKLKNMEYPYHKYGTGMRMSVYG